MNRITLSGNICRDIEVYKYNNKSCVKNSIAVKREFKNKNDEYETDFFNFTAWGTHADFINKYATKGDRILISGQLFNNEYETEDGTKKYNNDIQLDHIEILVSKKNKNEEETIEKIFDEPIKKEIASIDDLLD